MIIFIIIIRIYLKKIKIIFTEYNQNKYEVKINESTTLGRALDLYYVKKGIQNKNIKLFMINGKNITSNENYEKKIKDYIKKDNDGELNILVFSIKE